MNTNWQKILSRTGSWLLLYLSLVLGCWQFYGGCRFFHFYGNDRIVPGMPTLLILIGLAILGAVLFILSDSIHALPGFVAGLVLELVLLTAAELPLIRRMPLHVCQKKTIARRVGIHPSTLARAIQDKYFLFRGKLLPIEVLFASASIQNNSQAELTALIRQQIDQESPDCPLSDLQIAMRLREENLNVSRQLIAKLRKAAGIPSSYHRHLDNG